MMRNNIVLTSSLSILSQLLRVVPLFFFKKGNMERVRESKKEILSFVPPFADILKRSFYLLSALLTRSFRNKILER